MRFVVAIITLGLVACAPAQADYGVYKDDVVKATPISQAVAASNTYFFCKAHPEPDRYDVLCEACDVTLHVDRDDAGELVGIIAYATHFYHELKPRGDIPTPRISASGEHADQDYTSDKPLKAEARQIFDEANAWCQARNKGDFLVLKDEIDSVFGEDE